MNINMMIYKIYHASIYEACFWIYGRLITNSREDYISSRYSEEWLQEDLFFLKKIMEAQ